ncbi:MAG: MlaE family lipid ABC transporter permease subunit, partial [Desulfovibrio sp.]|jgi:phospholipid/cholesterol/gamma-HCH transport system permease protein|nr:MlaE family lipid ABC transporter permease subunit [Desulfovibrio sp.]
VHSLRGIEDGLPSALKQLEKKVELDIAGVTRLDTTGALLLNLTAERLGLAGKNPSITGTDDLTDHLLKKAALPAPERRERPKRPPAAVALCNAVGKQVCDVAVLMGELTSFLGRFLVTLLSLIRHPGNMRWTSLAFHMEQVGLRAVPIVGLLTFLIGLVVAYMGAQQLTMFGAQVFAVNLLEVTVLREMAVLITSIVVAGRSSSSFTAQIGAMVANEEVDALRSMGLDPNTLLVAPRVLALTLCLPMLVFIADVMSLLGGAAALWYTMDMNLNTFVSQLGNVTNVNNFTVGLVKTPFFAVSIGLVGCFQGFRATGSAESVGFLTTISVVQSIFAVILLDALFAIFFTTLGI